LAEGVGEEVGVGAELAEGVAGGAPAGGGGVDGWGVGEGLEDEVAGVAAAGGSDLPVVGRGAALEVGGLEAEVGSVEDGFEGTELVEDGRESGVGGEEGFARSHSSIVGAVDLRDGDARAVWDGVGGAY
jgi:hypothetical protein